MSALLFAPPQAVAARMRDRPLVGDRSLMPPLNAGQALRKRIAEFLSVSELIILTTRTEAGWPVTHCMHFGSVTGDRMQPVLYLFSKPDTRKLVNVAAEPRVSLMVYAPHNEPDSSRMPSVQLHGLCTIIDDPAEKKYSMECQFGKVGYGFSRLLGLHKQPALRIDVVQAIWSDPADGNGPATVDYLDAPKA